MFRLHAGNIQTVCRQYIESIHSVFSQYPGLFNLGLAVLLSHLLVKRVENCGTLCLTHRKFVRHVGAEFL